MGLDGLLGGRDDGLHGCASGHLHLRPLLQLPPLLLLPLQHPLLVPLQVALHLLLQAPLLLSVVLHTLQAPRGGRMGGKWSARTGKYAPPQEKELFYQLHSRDVLRKSGCEKREAFFSHGLLRMVYTEGFFF